MEPESNLVQKPCLGELPGLSLKLLAPKGTRHDEDSVTDQQPHLPWELSCWQCCCQQAEQPVLPWLGEELLLPAQLQDHVLEQPERPSPQSLAASWTEDIRWSGAGCWGWTRPRSQRSWALCLLPNGTPSPPSNEHGSTPTARAAVPDLAPRSWPCDFCTNWHSWSRWAQTPCSRSTMMAEPHKCCMPHPSDLLHCRTWTPADRRLDQTHLPKRSPPIWSPCGIKGSRELPQFHLPRWHRSCHQPPMNRRKLASPGRQWPHMSG